MLCAAPTVLIGIANAPDELRAAAPARRARADRRRAAGRGDHRADRGRTRLGDHAGLRPDRDLAVHHHLRAAPGARRALSADERADDQGAPGRRADDLGRAPRRRRGGQRGPARRRRRIGEIVVRGNVVMKGYYNDPEATAARHPRRLVPHRRRGGRPSRRLRRDPRPPQGRHHQRRREHLLGRGRGRAAAPPGGAGGGRRRAARTSGGARRRTPSSSCGPARRRPRTELRAVRPRPPGALQGADAVRASSTELPKTATGKIQKYVLRGGKAAIARAVARETLHPESPRERGRNVTTSNGQSGGPTGISIDDVFADPAILNDKVPTDPDVQSLIDDARSRGWQVTTLRQGTHRGQGLKLTQMFGRKRGDRLILWHPGGGHHGPDPYWKVSSGITGTVRIFSRRRP